MYPEPRQLDEQRQTHWAANDAERGLGAIKCAICLGPLADHEIGDHDATIVERMLNMGFPTPVGARRT